MANLGAHWDSPRTRWRAELKERAQPKLPPGPCEQLLIFPWPCSVFVIESQWDAEAPATTVELTCDSSEEAVYWKKDSEWKQEGKSLSVAVKELPDAGNYSCLSQESHELLSSNLLLIAKIDSEGQMIRWILKSFKGTTLKCWGCPCPVLCRLWEHLGNVLGKGFSSKALLTVAGKSSLLWLWAVQLMRNWVPWDLFGILQAEWVERWEDLVQKTRAT